ncbi:unnamed protein product [Adineta steineri]|uniref:Uncharacterized protein n=1 Tax=Adineta steineri TaxID=433720 RepID=A0A818UJ68_9BILA|nr:unnamed protein product [Adineta steineri]CAF3698787.1 unnamed protein product [Adineta steineri]CAF4213006.1 unnamed protein product [Adineta steineri]
MSSSSDKPHHDHDKKFSVKEGLASTTPHALLRDGTSATIAGAHSTSGANHQPHGTSNAGRAPPTNTNPAGHRN